MIKSLEKKNPVGKIKGNGFNFIVEQWLHYNTLNL